MATPRSDTRQLGLMHGLSDAAAGFIIGSWAIQLPSDTLLTLVVGYNLLAFALQPVVSLLPVNWYRPGLIFCLLLSTFALLLPHGLIWTTMVCLGAASCGFHVLAGSLSLDSARGNSGAMAWFVAPGVLGLFCGIAAAIQGWTATGLLIGCGLLITAFRTPAFRPSEPPQQQQPPAPCSPLFWIISGLLLFIALRSAVWSYYQNDNSLFTPHLLLLAGISACAGKLAGGWLAQRYHWQRVLIISLILASACFFLFGVNSQRPLLLAGLACLQAGTPILLVRLNHYLHNSALAAALGLGTAITVGWGLFWLLPTVYTAWLGLLPAVLAAGYWLFINTRKRIHNL